MKINPVSSGSYQLVGAVGSSGDAKAGQAQPASGGAGGQGQAPPPRVKKSTSTSSASSTKVYDKRDLNKDGTVSAMEQLRYDVTHPQDVKKAFASSKTGASDSIDYTA